MADKPPTTLPLPHPLEEGYFCFVLLLEVYYRLKGGSLKRRDLEHPAVCIRHGGQPHGGQEASWQGGEHWRAKLSIRESMLRTEMGRKGTYAFLRNLREVFREQPWKAEQLACSTSSPWNTCCWALGT